MLLAPVLKITIFQPDKESVFIYEIFCPPNRDLRWLKVRSWLGGENFKVAMTNI